MQFNPACRSCPRLFHYRQRLKAQYPLYHNAPVAPFAGCQARILLVGLAPGLHGANRSGRPFTGDQSGSLLFEVLHGCGLASATQSTAAGDGLRLSGLTLTNAVKCVPPQNLPTAREIRLCSRYLSTELQAGYAVLVALGKVAHDALLRCLGQRLADYRFAHGAEHVLEGRVLLDSYHCSRYNVNTGRMNAAMLRDVMLRAQRLAGGCQ